jgi:DNA-binding NarL/FixJ family response regulator
VQPISRRARAHHPDGVMARDHAVAVWNFGRTGTTMPGSMSARVLIVDDQRAFRKAARGLLERRGYVAVGEACDAAEAVDLGVRLLPDAVLLDVRLGEDDGFAVARAQARACPGAAVLLVSCDDHSHETDRLAASGARGFVPKSQLAVADLAEYWPGQ